MQYIHLIKDALPYKCDIQLEGETFTFTFYYNAEYDYFTVDLAKGDDVILYGDKIVYGKPLFSTFNHIEKPKLDIIPFDKGNKETRVTYENIGDSVFLYVVGEEDVI